jgi:hypothetical protein
MDNLKAAVVFLLSLAKNSVLTLILLTWRIWWAVNNASKWQMGFNWAFKGLMLLHITHFIDISDHMPSTTFLSISSIYSGVGNKLEVDSQLISMASLLTREGPCFSTGTRLARPHCQFKLLKTKLILLYIRNQSVPRCKHFPPRL